MAPSARFNAAHDARRNLQDIAMNAMPNPVVIREVGLRDGLQSIARVLPTAQKLEWIRDAYAAGQREIDFIASSTAYGVRAPSPSQSNAVQRRGTQNGAATFSYTDTAIFQSVSERETL